MPVARSIGTKESVYKLCSRVRSTTWAAAATTLPEARPGDHEAKWELLDSLLYRKTVTEAAKAGRSVCETGAGTRCARWGLRARFACFVGRKMHVAKRAKSGSEFANVL